jgi:ubiquinone/menaquinone biosynthesis C-methylase UbiE
LDPCLLAWIRGANLLSASVRSEFDEYASDYFRSLNNPIRDLIKDNYYFVHAKALIINQLIDFDLKEKAHINLVDMGAGIGLFERFIHSDRVSVFGMDLSYKMLQVANSIHNIYRRSFCQADGEFLPLPDDSADIVFSSCVLHHVATDKIEAVLRDLVRVCKVGGYVIIFEHNPYNPLTQLVVRTTYLDRNARLISHRKVEQIASRVGVINGRSEFILYGSLGIDQFINRRLSFLNRFPLLGGQYYFIAQKKA